MGIGKLGKKLDKVARKVRKALGPRGKELAQAVFERAISILEAEMREVAKRQGAAERAKRKRAPSSPARAPAPRKSPPSRRKPSKKAASRPSADESGIPAATQDEPSSEPDTAQPSPVTAAELGETST